MISSGSKKSTAERACAPGGKRPLTGLATPRLRAVVEFLLTHTRAAGTDARVLKGGPGGNQKRQDSTSRRICQEGSACGHGPHHRPSDSLRKAPRMIDLPAIDTIAAYIAPMEVDRRKRHRKISRRAVAIGAIIMLADGTKCRVVAYDQNDQPLCEPITEGTE